MSEEPIYCGKCKEFFPYGEDSFFWTYSEEYNDVVCDTCWNEIKDNDDKYEDGSLITPITRSNR